jgi:uncharacterized protein YjiK
MTLMNCFGLLGCTQPRAADFQIADQRYSSDRSIQFKLPKVLREISGLTLDPAGRLFAVNDEQAIIYSIDYQAGRVLYRFALQGGIRDDFEGIASADGLLYLVSSRGIIYQTRYPAGSGKAEQIVPYTRFDQPVNCEVEGLTHSKSLRALLVACKNLPGDGRLNELGVKAGIHIHVWSLVSKSYDPTASVIVPRIELDAFFNQQGMEPGTLQPTGINIAPNGNLVIIAARQHLLLELTPDGSPVGMAKLKKSRHRQTEGIAITATGRLLLADEGEGKGKKNSRGRLSIYEPGG